MTPTFGAICLDTMAAPHSFSVADHLEKAATVPVFANGHHGTGVLVYAALLNALKVVGKSLDRSRIVINGAGVAGIGVARLLRRMGAHDLVVCDRAGAIYSYREERMNWATSSVCTMPGQIAFTRICSCAWSSAMAFVISVTAPFDAA